MPAWVELLVAADRLTPSVSGLQIGIDLGGTKIAGVLLDAQERVVAQSRLATPRGDYPATLVAIKRLVRELEAAVETSLNPPIAVGVGCPGVRLPDTGLMISCNSVWLNDQPLLDDLVATLERPVMLANDADCMALSEWHRYRALQDRALLAPGATLFGVILGTGVGGGWVHEGHLLAGPNGLTGEWGHTPMPYFQFASSPGNPLLNALESRLASRPCYCGRLNCIETFLSGPGLQQIHHDLWQCEATPQQLNSTWVDYFGAQDTGAAATEQPGLNAALLHDLSGASDQQQRLASLSLYLDMLARSLAQVVNVMDPQAIVLAGGLSNMTCLFDELPRRIVPYLFSRDACATQILPPLGGDSSGVFGAAQLVKQPTKSR